MYSPKFQKSETQKKTNEQTNELNNKHHQKKGQPPSPTRFSKKFFQK